MAVIIDKNVDKEIFSALDYLKIKYYKSTSIDFLYEPVKTHPDMQIHFLNKKCAVAAPYVFSYYREILPQTVTLYKGTANPGEKYPEDCSYNVARVGGRVIGNLQYVEPLILQFYKNINYEFIDVKQGYCKCNLCIVDENSVITEDDGLWQTLSQYDLNVLKIQRGEVQLKNFPYGFIGGATGKFDDNKMLFMGSIHKTSYFNDVKCFLSERNIEFINLSESHLKDFGSILFFEDGI